MGLNDYKNKMNIILNDKESYEKMDTDPLTTLQKNTFELINGWRIDGLLGEKITGKDLITDNTNIFKMCQLPKIRKINYSLRPVVSCINIPTYFLTKFSKKIISHALPKPKSFIKNAIKFKESIINNEIPNNSILLSLDASSLFTNISLDLVLKGIGKR